MTYRNEDAKGQSDALVVDLANPQMPGLSDGAPWLKVDLRRDVTGPEARVSRGAISLIQMGQGVAVAMPTLPAKGVSLQVAMPTLDLDAWQGLRKVFQPEGAESRAGDAGNTYVPDTMSIQASTVLYQQRTLRDVSATVAHPAEGVWRAQLESQQVAGQVEWLPDASPSVQTASHGAGRIVARLTRLTIPAAEAQSLEDQAAEQILSADSTGASVPALDIVIDQFNWRGLSLGRLEVEASNRLLPVSAGAAIPEWRLTKLKLGAPEAQLSATGAWSAQAPSSVLRRLGLTPRLRPRSSFDFTLDLQNLGDTLTRLGLP
ncbi:MAG TPA: hypothetical protein VFH49_08110, partial [Aquabacterium sp.]|nr:hypothetical protein [Aquabacterium sp.]